MNDLEQDLLIAQAVVNQLREENRLLQAEVLSLKQMAVTHGRWIVKPLPMRNDPPDIKPWNVRYYCSQCDFTTGPTNANYCPNCGAKMGGEA